MPFPRIDITPESYSLSEKWGDVPVRVPPRSELPALRARSGSEGIANGDRRLSVRARNLLRVWVLRTIGTDSEQRSWMTVFRLEATVH